MGFSGLVAGLVLLACCAAAGFLAGNLHARRVASPKRQIPRQWPLDARGLINLQERKVWHWLRQTFPDHHVMIKIAVTRFTLPRPDQNARQLYQVLNGVHCTFTVCGGDGRVIGCVDVPGPQGISRLNRHIKLSLLSQCGIVYRAVQASDLPTATEIRIDFLGEEAFSLFDRHREKAAVSNAQQELRATVKRLRHNRDLGSSGVGPAAALQEMDSGNSDYDTGFGPSAWQPNSFLAPLDTRPAGLQ